LWFFLNVISRKRAEIKRNISVFSNFEVRFCEERGIQGYETGKGSEDVGNKGLKGGAP